ncbi:hypothetical protein GCM10009087_38100 [Sphingomonas oligophenolica]|uniref:Uncharacterized protein n=1 Tax=Sphingomonas oligophenolica TaxID=301154 RepID=A0ABU9Y4Y1_9SPHN
MRLGYIALFTAVMTGPAVAKQTEASGRAQAFQRLVDCRAIKETADRLACYDREVASLDAAEKAKDVVIVDKEQIRDAKRSLFGLTLPHIRLFGDANDKGPAEVAQIESKIASSREGVEGWTIRLEDGSVWQQTDTGPFYRSPKPGLDVVVKRGALGSFVMRVAGSPGVKVKRIL